MTGEYAAGAASGPVVGAASGPVPGTTSGPVPGAGELTPEGRRSGSVPGEKLPGAALEEGAGLVAEGKRFGSALGEGAGLVPGEKLPGPTLETGAGAVPEGQGTAAFGVGQHASVVRHFAFPSDGEVLVCAQAVPAAKAAPAVPAVPTDPAAPTASVTPAAPTPPSPLPSTPPPHAVLVLHGAGNGDKQSPTVLAAAFAARGHHALAFDFSGHGESTGTLGRLSLRRRFEQARAVVDACLPAEAPLVLVGFSMSGQTVADLAAHYGPRVAAIGLCAPAVYTAQAWPVAFGDGFTGIIRTPGSWRKSPALDVFRGLPAGVRAVLVTPAVDAVIPPAVTEAVAEALDASRAAYVRMVLPAADHRLSLWFAAEARSREEFVDVLLNGGRKSSPRYGPA